MDLITKISSLVACVESSELFEWWETESDTPRIPSYWKKKGTFAVLKTFGSNGTVIDLRPYTSILGTKQTLKIKGWVSTSNEIILVVDPKSLPTDTESPYIILSMASDMIEYELVINQIKSGAINPCSYSILSTIGYRDKYRRIVRFDIPEELE